MSSSLRGEVCGELLHATGTSVWVRVKMPGGVTGVKMARRHCSYSTQSQLTENTVVQVFILASRVSHPKGLTQLSPGLSHSDQVTPLGP